ncbi:hypothetical protein [Winogradskyella sp. A3E31]|uniref:hypothetical protein n=1 Tax=Winogradskyella sp. A3E31 TaxID=3349637 RepID=UPI00398B8B7C
MQYEKTPKYKLDRTIEFLNAFLEVKFENYIVLQDFIENHISTVQKEIDQKYDEVDKIEDTDEWNVAMENLEDELASDGFKFDHEFPNRIRYSSIIQTYSMLEVYLKWLCESLKKINNFPIGLTDLKGNSDLEKGKLYLKRIYKVDFNKLNPEWKFLNDMRKIRNQIIHKNGDFTTKDTEIIKIINQNENLGVMWDDIYPTLEPDKDYEIKIKSKELNKTFIENVRKFFDKVVIEIKESGINTA